MILIMPALINSCCTFSDVKTAPMEQRKVMTTLQRPDTAPAFIKAEDFEKHRPLSTMTTRSSSTNNLSALVTGEYVMPN